MVTLVLLPGMDGTGTLFDPLLAALGDSTKSCVVRYPVEGLQSYERLTGIAQEQLPGSGPLVLLGESFSGPVATALAVHLADRVAGLVLCCSFLRCPRPVAKPLASLLQALPPTPVPLALAASMLLGRFQTPALREKLKAALMQVPTSVLKQRLMEVVNVNAVAQAARVRTPALYLRAAADRLVPESAARLVESAIPAAKVRVLEGPHCLLQAAPSASAAMISEFLAELPEP